MAGVRYDIDYYNTMKSTSIWRCEIADRDSQPFFQDIDLAPPGVILSNEGDSRSLLPGIYPTTATITILVDGAQKANLIQDIVESDEERFIIRVFRGGTLMFQGFIAIDIAQVENDSYPYAFEVSAIDGLARLQDIEYSDDGTAYTGIDSIHDHMFKALSKMNNADYYSGLPFLYVSCDWYESKMSSNGINPLEESGVDHRVWSPGGSPDASSWDVLEDICKVFNARLYYTEGAYHFEQIGTRSEMFFRRFVYDVTGGQMGIQPEVFQDFSFDGVDYAIENGSVFRYLAPLREVKVQFDITLRDVIDDNLVFREDFPSQGNDYTTLTEICTVAGDGENNGFLKATLTLPFEYYSFLDTVEAANNGYYFPHTYFWRMELKYTNLDNPTVGTRWLKRVLGDPYTANGLPSTGVSDTQEFVDIHGYEVFQANGELIYNYTDVINLFIPAADGELVEIEMRIWLYDTATPDLSDPPIELKRTWECRPKLEFDSAGSGQRTISIVTVARNDTKNSRVIESNIRFADYNNNPKGVLINDGVDWVPSGYSWSKGVISNGGEKLQKLLAEEMLALRKSTRRILQGGVIAYDQTFFSRFYYDNGYFLPTRIDHHTMYDTLAGDLIEVRVDDTGGVDINENTILTDGEPILPPLVGDWNPLDPPFTPVIVTDENITSGNTSITLDVYNNTGITIAAGSWIQIFDPTTGSYELVQITENIDGTTNQTIDIVSTTWVNSFPIGTPISLAPVTQFKWISESFFPTTSTASLVITKGALSAPSDADQVDEFCKVHWNGNKLYWAETPNTWEEFGINTTTNAITRGTGNEFDSGDRIQVEVLTPIA